MVLGASQGVSLENHKEREKIEGKKVKGKGKNMDLIWLKDTYSSDLWKLVSL